MQPYGIVYEENLYSLEQSVIFWHKKCGVMKISVLLKMAAVIFGIYALIAAATFLFSKDIFYPLLVMLLFATNIALLPVTVKNTFLRPTARANFQKGNKQLVLFEERLEYTTPFGKSVYYYDDIVAACEKNGVISILVDTATLPFCVPSGCVKKGEYSKFSALLQQQLGAKFERGKK